MRAQSLFPQNEIPITPSWSWVSHRPVGAGADWAERLKSRTAAGKRMWVMTTQMVPLSINRTPCAENLSRAASIVVRPFGSGGQIPRQASAITVTEKSEPGASSAEHATPARSRRIAQRRGRVISEFTYDHRR